MWCRMRVAVMMRTKGVFEMLQQVFGTTGVARTGGSEPTPFPSRVFFTFAVSSPPWQKTCHPLPRPTPAMHPSVRIPVRQLQSKAERFERISWKTSAAYVVFNHETSVTRCLADYARYPLWMQPRQLRFRQTHKIKVQRVRQKYLL